MGKKSRSKGNNKGNQKQKKVKDTFGVEDYNDEIDDFSVQREKVKLGDENEEEGGDNYEEDFDKMVMENSDDDDDNDDEIDPHIMKRMMKFDDQSDEDDEDENEEEKLESWGKKRSNFYRSDVKDDGSDREAEEEEEKEAKRLLNKHYHQMSANDFQLEDFDDEKDKKNKKKGKVEDDIESEEDEELREKFKKAAKELDEVSLDDEAIERVSVAALKLSKKEKLEILKNESPEFQSLLADFKSKIHDLKSSLSPLLTKAKKELPTHKGISLLEVEYHLLLSYCMNISYYFLLKAEGKKVADHPVILHLVKLRVLLEKIKPIDQKLRYQIEKLLRMSENGDTSKQKDDPLRFKPNFASLDDNEDDDELEGENQLYSVKKIAPAFYDDPEEKKKKQRERQRKLAARGAIAEYVQSEFTDLPEEERTSGVGDSNSKEMRDHNEREKYEEEYFVRLTESKKDRLKRERALFRSEFDNPIDYKDISGLDENEEDKKKSQFDAILKKSKLSNIISNLEQRRKDVGGDVDIPRNSINKRKLDQLNQKTISYGNMDDNYDDGFLPNENDDNNGQDNEEDDEDDDEFYKMVQAKKKRKIEEDDVEKEDDRVYMDENVDDGDKRPISWNIKSNKGLTPHRKKEVRNPRKKYRNKAVKADKKQSAMGKKLRDKTQTYGGEATGIRKNLTKSRKLN